MKVFLRSLYHLLKKVRCCESERAHYTSYSYLFLFVKLKISVRDSMKLNVNLTLRYTWIFCHKKLENSAYLYEEINMLKSVLNMHAELEVACEWIITGICESMTFSRSHTNIVRGFSRLPTFTGCAEEKYKYSTSTLNPF